MAGDPELILAGRYRILDRIGQGGMGTLWRARDTELDRDVAVKELRLPDVLDEEERRVRYARMDREARAAARLRHPGIVTVYDRVIGDDGRPWIVMELVHGGSLAELLREDERGRLPAARVARIGLHMVEALAAAHVLGVVHRDVKPANVLLEGDDRVVLTDFGIAALDGDTTLTRSGTVLGTPAFMSPEQVRGLPVTPRSDLWSLGATLYAAAEGRPPFTGPTHGSVYIAITTEEPAPVVHAGPLSEVLDGLLRKDPDDRWPVERVRDRLAFLARDAVPIVEPAPKPASAVALDPTAAAPTAGTVMDAPASRKQAIALGVLFVVACAVVIVAGTLWPEPRRGTAGPAPSPTASGIGGPDYLTFEALRYSPDGRTLASAGKRTVRLWDPATGRAIRTLDAQGDTGPLEFSPDGGTVAARAGDDVRLWEVSTGRLVRAFTGLRDQVADIDFNRDGDRLAGSDHDGNIRIWDVATGRTVTGITATAVPSSLDSGPDLDPVRVGIPAVAFSPDGKTLITGEDPGWDPYGRMTPRTRLWDAATGRSAGVLRTRDRQVRSLADRQVRSLAFSRDGTTLAAATFGGTIELWSWKDRRRFRIVTGVHYDSDIAFGPDGKVIAGIDEKQNSVRLWDVSTGRVTADFHSQAGSLAFSPDGSKLAGGSAVGDTITIWNLR
ncbi:WD40 repeat domain-containing serine/threonine protein kinase [Actinomadura sp. 3N508]|uniref:WD40 repeat domain-containing serine/threonine protein kinase n=1 Tax=Actinomadura sp. 3N508 TaxID=3375153 RepID=UPI00378DF677